RHGDIVVEQVEMGRKFIGFAELRLRRREVLTRHGILTFAEQFFRLLELGVARLSRRHGSRRQCRERQKTSGECACKREKSYSSAEPCRSRAFRNLPRGSHAREDISVVAAICNGCFRM